MSDGLAVAICIGIMLAGLNISIAITMGCHGIRKALERQPKRDAGKE